MEGTARGGMLTNRCGSCGTIGADGDQFCASCGARLAPTAPPYPYYAPGWAPPRESHTGLIVAIVVIVLVVAFLLPALVYFYVSSVMVVPPPPPRFLGVTVTTSSDGTNWILTFTSVPTDLPQNGTMLSVISSSGTALLSPTTLYLLESGLNGVRYIPYLTGPSYTLCSPGDRILLAFGTGPSQYPSGTQVQITSTANVLYAGTLQ